MPQPFGNVVGWINLISFDRRLDNILADITAVYISGDLRTCSKKLLRRSKSGRIWDRIKVGANDVGEFHETCDELSVC